MHRKDERPLCETTCRFLEQFPPGSCWAACALFGRSLATRRSANWYDAIKLEPCRSWNRWGGAGKEARAE